MCDARVRELEAALKRIRETADEGRQGEDVVDFPVGKLGLTQAEVRFGNIWAIAEVALEWGEEQ